MKEYILTCRDALDGGFLYLIRDHKHFLEDSDHYSIKVSAALIIQPVLSALFKHRIFRI